MRVTVPPLEGGVIVGFENGEGSIEHFPARHNHNIKAGRYHVAPEHLA
jgi:hypothetical protein